MILVFTHNDLDGVGCGIVARCAFGEQADIRYNSVSSLNPQVERFLAKMNGAKKRPAEVFITDLSVNSDNEERMTAYAKAGGTIRLIDHHKSALHLNRHHWSFVQVEYTDGRPACATSLFYEHLVEKGHLQPTQALAQFVELVRQYDTWDWERLGNQMAKRLNDLFYMVSIDEFEGKMVQRLQEHDEFFFDDFETKILEIEEERIERYVRRKRREMVQTYVGEECIGIVHAESYHSELGNELGKEHAHLDYIVILNMGGRKVSLRTVHDGIDVSEIAGRYGGGGHSKAAGCNLSEELYRIYVAEPFAIEPMQPDAFRNTYNVKDNVHGSLYVNRQDDRLWIYQSGGEWHIEENGERLELSFPTFAAAERHVKRHYAAWLARDEAFVKYLCDYVTDSQTKRMAGSAAAAAPAQEAVRDGELVYA
ncbi:DHH family phosphoesterase [Paenibacillus chartarius]|uniref:DHH family phosphoesterase n=1 Tax=Paenibacillus chartarius TaxID=747481 RepID=A0ABV6DQ20_9BACL